MYSGTDPRPDGQRTTQDNSRGVVVMWGASNAPVCGVRDYAVVVGDAMRRQGLPVYSRWTELGSIRSQRGRRRACAVAAREVVDTATAREGSIVWNYSVFTWGHRGVPFFVPSVARALRRRPASVRCCTILHEPAVYWGWNGAKGLPICVLQRAALWLIVRCSDELVVSLESRAEWLSSRWWLPRRGVTAVPVPSNLPDVSGEGIEPINGRVGIVAYGAEAQCPEVVAEAIARCNVQDVVVLGAPGSASAAGQRLTSALNAQRIPHRFTEVIERIELAREMARCAVIIFADPAGPSTRRTMTAATLASGAAIVGFIGSETARDLGVDEGVFLTSPSVEEVGSHLSDALTLTKASRVRDRRSDVIAAMSTDALVNRLLPLIRGG